MNYISERPTILIVDDSPTICKLMSAILENDFNIIISHNGRDALKIAANHQPDLILLDIIMPGIDGYDVIKTLKTDPSLQEIPVIFVTSKSQNEDEIYALGLGAVDYITKDFNPHIFKLRISKQIESKMHTDFLGKLSLQDELTGIPNRRAFDRYFQQEWLRAKRNGTEMSLFMIDIDHFKKYNDTYGHQAGDECLRKVSETINLSLVRPADLVARYGGEEFACVLPETSNKGAITAAERILTSVEALNIPHQPFTLASHATISIGVTSFIPTHNNSPEDFIKEADLMLYKAKSDGRNRIAAKAV